MHDWENRVLGTQNMKRDRQEDENRMRFTPDSILDMETAGGEPPAAGSSGPETALQESAGETDELNLEEWDLENLDLEDAIQRQTILEQPGLADAYHSNQKASDSSAEGSVRPGTSSDSGRTGAGGRRRTERSRTDGKTQERKRTETAGPQRRAAEREERKTRYSEDDDLLYEEYELDDEEDRAGRRKDRRTAGGRRETARPALSKKEQKEYEEFLAYKEARNRSGRKDVRQEQKKRKRHPLRRFLCLLLLLLIVLPLLYVAARMNGIMEGVSTSDIKDLISEEVQKSQETGAMAGYTNIALFGLDSTEQSLESGNNRTDVMIIASINDRTGDVKLVSVYRDTYLDIGNGNYQKANAAYAYGGPEQAITMLNTNLDLNITDYATIGFGGVADMIDAVGGIEIDVQQDEIDHLNNYQSTMATELGKEYVPLTSTGLQTLNGLQATAYCRIRYTDGGDFKRTERQKEVLSKTFAKLKSAGPVAMLKAADSLASEVRTSLNAAEISALVLKALRMNIADTSGFPNEQYRTVGYIGDQSCVIPIHLTDNVTWLHQYLFDDTGYEVSQTVQSISNEISARSGY